MKGKLPMSNAAKLQTLNPEIELEPFRKAIGNCYDKIVADTKSMLGRVKEQEVTVKASAWKASAGFKLVSREGYTVQLASNNPCAILLCFAMRFNELARSAGCEIVATSIPKACEAWIEENSRKVLTANK